MATFTIDWKDGNGRCHRLVLKCSLANAQSIADSIYRTISSEPTTGGLPRMSSQCSKVGRRCPLSKVYADLYRGDLSANPKKEQQP